MDTVITFVHWLNRSGLPEVFNAYSWLWPVFEILHFAGMVMLIGTVGLLDLRLLGVARSLRPAPFQRLVPWGLAGFAINAVTGVLFVAGNQFADTEYVPNPAFHWKLIFIALAALNAGLFYVLGIGARVDALAEGERAPLPAKLIAATSLCLWVGVIAFGRLFPYMGDAF
jgi:hypothetical protein